MNDSKILVKQLREMTGAGILDCKKYLIKANNNIDEAIKLFRSEAGVKADKKGARIAAEGIVNYYQNEKNILLLELNSETDFVARDSNFIDLAKSIANKLLENDESDVINEISDEIKSIISKLGENIKLRRFTKIAKNNYVYGYAHNNKIASIVELKEDDEKLAKDICMQIVASNPLGLDENSIDPKVLANEKEVYKIELDKLDKKDDIKRNIMEGKIKKFISDNTLLNQPFIKDSGLTLNKILKDNEIIYFKRYQLGEGIDKKKEDFAEEVYNQIK